MVLTYSRNQLKRPKRSSLPSIKQNQLIQKLREPEPVTRALAALVPRLRLRVELQDSKAGRGRRKKHAEGPAVHLSFFTEWLAGEEPKLTFFF